MCSLFKVNTLSDVDVCISMLLIAFFFFHFFLNQGVHLGWVNTLDDVSLKKINFYGERKKLQLLNYFKGESSKIYFLNENVYYKSYKK